MKPFWRVHHDLPTRYRNLVACVSLILTAACTDWGGSSLRYGPAELDHSNLNVAVVEGDVLFVSDDLALPRDIAIVGARLVVLDAQSDSAVHVLDRETGVQVRTFGRRGEGPGEFKGAWSVDPILGSSSEYWIYDVSLGRLTYVDLREDFFDAGDLGRRMINLDANAMSLGPIRTADANTSLSLGMFTDGRLGVFDGNGVLQETVGSLPPGAEEIPAQVRQHAYQATLIPHPTRTLFAAANRHASLIEIFKEDGSRVSTREGPLHVEPTYQVGRRGDRAVMVTGDDLRFGYIDGTASSRYVFSVFSGRTREGARGSQYMGRFVHVFDWAGEFVKAIELDADVIAIAVATDSSVLYALRHDPYPAVLRYSLAGVLPTRGEDRRLADD